MWRSPLLSKTVAGVHLSARPIYSFDNLPVTRTAGCPGADAASTARLAAVGVFDDPEGNRVTVVSAHRDQPTREKSP